MILFPFLFQSNLHSFEMRENFPPLFLSVRWREQSSVGKKPKDIYISAIHLLFQHSLAQTLNASQSIDNPRKSF